MDEPDPTGRWAPLCPAANLMAESDWIHANVPGAQTFIVMINANTSIAPVYANTYNPGNSHIDLYAPDPYPCRTEVGGAITAGLPAPLWPQRRREFRVIASCQSITRSGGAAIRTTAAANTPGRPRARKYRF